MFLFESDFEQAFNIYILVASLANLLHHAKSEDNYAEQFLTSPSADPIESRAIEFFNRNIQSIEINFHDNLHKVFFPIHPACWNLSQFSKNQFETTVSRDTPNDKINGLIEFSEKTFIEMKHSSWLKSLPFQFTSGRLDFFRDMSTLLGFIINITMAATL